MRLTRTIDTVYCVDCCIEAVYVVQKAPTETLVFRIRKETSNRYNLLVLLNRWSHLCILPFAG